MSTLNYSTILHKRSSVAGRVPSLSALSLGELAINLYDGKLFIKTLDGTIETFTGNKQIAINLASRGMSTSVIDVVPRDRTFDSVAPQSEAIHLSTFVPTVDITASNITMSTGDHAGSNIDTAKMGVYQINEETDTATLIATTANSTSAFTEANTLYTLPLLNSCNLVAGTLYAAAVLVKSINMPHLLSVNSTGLLNALPPLNAALVSSQTSLTQTVSNWSNSSVKFYARVS